MAFGVAHKIGDYQVIIHIAHTVYDLKLIGKPVGHRLFRRPAVYPMKSLITSFFKKLKMITVSYIKPRQLDSAEFKGNIAALGYSRRICYSLRRSAEDRIHLIGGFKVKLVCLELDGIFLVYFRACLYAEKHLMRPVIVVRYIMHVIRSGKRYSCFLRYPYYLPVYSFLLGYSVVLKL